MKTEAADLAARAAPPAAVGAAHYVLGLSLPDWVSILTICWLLLIIGEKFYQWLRKEKPDNLKRRRRTD